MMKKIENKNYRDKPRKIKDNYDKIFNHINQEYWVNIENIVLEYDWKKIPKEVHKMK